MKKRDKLISIVIKNNGDYNKIKQDIFNNVEVNEKICNNCITIFDREYPKDLMDLKDPPFVLFYKGNLSLLKEDKIGIVGSRMASDYALNITKLLAKNRNEVIVSGMAKGIDYMAQSNAKKTIGILGCGINYIYPSCNRKLFDEVINNGLLLSEYPDMTLPLASHFPFRNRIIAALSKELYIMDIKEKSGTMTSVNEALTLGKDIKVLPYPVIDDSDSYNNKLISEGAGIILKEDLFN